MSEIQVNGSLLRGALKYVKASGFPGGIPAILEGIPGEHQEAFQRSFVPGSWYPYDTYGILLEAIDRKIGQNDGTEILKMGRYAAQQDASTGFKIVRIFVSVAKVAAIGHQFWPRTVSKGEFSPIEHGDTFTRTELLDFPEIHPLHCRVLQGWFEGMCLILRAREATTEHSRCVHRGDSSCEFHVQWSK